MADGFSVDQAALNATAQGINNTIGALKGLGIDETGEEGRGFSLLSLTGLQAGQADLASAFGDFCDRWSWGVRSLVQDGNQFAARLGLSAGVYYDTEQYLTGVAKNVTVAVAGDPHLTDGQAAQASWSVDAGGIFSLLVTELGGPQMEEILRFEHDWEAAASIQLANGDIAALTAVLDPTVWGVGTVLADPAFTVFFDAAATSQREASLRKAIAAGTSTPLTTVTSSTTAIPRPTPNCR